jgi:GAF domain-containing protein
MTVEEVVERGGEADDVLRGVVAALQEEGAVWSGIAFVEGDGLELGPSAGGEPPDELERQPVEWQGSRVAELRASGVALDRLAQVAALIAPYCLVGWDTGGEPWSP